MATQMPPFRPRRRYMHLEDIDGNKVRAEITDWVVQKQRRSHTPKYLVLQQIRFPRTNKRPATQIRIGYYILGKRPRMRGRWTWGQYAPLIPRSDLHKLLEKAKRKGIL